MTAPGLPEVFVEGSGVKDYWRRFAPVVILRTDHGPVRAVIDVCSNESTCPRGMAGSAVPIKSRKARRVDIRWLSQYSVVCTHEHVLKLRSGTRIILRSGSALASPLPIIGHDVSLPVTT